MGFRSPDASTIRGYVSNFYRDTRGFVTLSIRIQHLNYVLDDGDMRDDAKSQWESLGSPDDTVGFLSNYLRNRYAMKSNITVSDPRPNNDGSSTEITIPFTTHIPNLRGTGTRFARWQWEESDLIPFNRVTGQRINEFDHFELGSHWLFSGGDSQYVDADSLDVNPLDVINFLGMGPVILPGTGVEKVTGTVEIVDLHTPEQDVVATFEEDWNYDFVDPDRRRDIVELTR